MRPRRTLLWLAVFAVVPARAGADPVRIALSVPPPMRVYCSLDNKEGGHVQVTWDPTVSQQLAQVVSLPDPAKWTISCGSEVLTTDSGPGSTGPLVIKFADSATDFTTRPKLDGVLVAVKSFDASQLTAELLSKKKFLTVSVEPATKLKWTAAKAGLAANEARAGGGRSLEDTVPKEVAELFQIFAEIAVERAKSKGFAILTERLQKFVCDDLKWDSELTKRLIPGGAPNRFATSGRILPSTCEVVQRLRVQDLLTSAKSLLFAFLDDVALLAMEAALSQVNTSANLKPLVPVLDRVSKLVVDVGGGRTTLTGREAQLLLVDLSKVKWTEVFGEEKIDPTKAAADAKAAALAAGKSAADAKAAADAAAKAVDEAPLSISKKVACGLELAFAVAAACHAQGGCDAREIARMVERPEDYFDSGEKACIEVQPIKVWPDLDLFVSQALDIIDPPKGATPRSITRAVLNLTFDVLERLHCGKPVGQCAPDNTLAILEDVRKVANGVIDEDLQPVLVALGSLVERALTDAAGKEKSEPKRRAIVKVTRLVGAFTSYAATYTGPQDDPKLVQAQHEARKKAVESLIDATTDRTQRDGDWVASLGVNVGFAGGGQMTFVGARDTGAVYPQLSLPFGVAVQRLPNNAGCKEQFHSGCYLGFHLQLSAIDLGQFVAYNSNGNVTPTRWDTFLMAGLQVGMALGAPNSTFFLGLDIRYAPTMFSKDAEGGAFRFGLFFGYYVPFFDFN